MFAPTPPKSSSRFALISVVMLCLLLASVGAAWLLVRRNPGTRGAALLDEVRTSGLEAYWHGTDEQWMLTYSSRDKPAGWRVSFRQAGEAGSFAGLDVVTHEGATRTPEILWSVWTLSADAARGDYQSGTLEVKRNAWRLKPDTRIGQADGQLDVSQGAAPLSILTQGPTPDNYIPEGTLPLLYFLTGRGKDVRRFRLIFNSNLPPRGSNKPPTVSEEVEPLTEFSGLPRHVPGAAVGAKVYLVAGGQRLLTRTYVYDRTGRMLALFSGASTEFVLADWPTVAKRYPAARTHLIALVRLLARRIGTFALPPHVVKGVPASPATAPTPPSTEPTGVPG